MKRLLSILLASIVLPGLAFADAKKAEVPDVNLSEFTLGETVSGDPVTPGDLRGKAVVLEFWGVNCGPCLAAMPGLEALYKRNRSKGFVIVGVHAQSASREEIKTVVKNRKVTFPIVENGNSPVPFDSIPRSFVFDAAGKLLYTGHPDSKDFDRAVRDAIKTVNPTGEVPDPFRPKTAPSTPKPDGPLVEERTWTAANGNTLVATLLSVENGVGKFKKRTGSTFTYEIAKLSSTDRDVIRQAQEALEKKDEEADDADGKDAKGGKAAGKRKS